CRDETALSSEGFWQKRNGAGSTASSDVPETAWRADGADGAGVDGVGEAVVRPAPARSRICELGQLPVSRADRSLQSRWVSEAAVRRSRSVNRSRWAVASPRWLQADGQAHAAAGNPE